MYPAVSETHKQRASRLLVATAVLQPQQTHTDTHTNTADLHQPDSCQHARESLDVDLIPGCYRLWLLPG